jgi:hypothetical protein
MLRLRHRRKGHPARLARASRDHAAREALSARKMTVAIGNLRRLIFHEACGHSPLRPRPWRRGLGIFRRLGDLLQTRKITAIDDGTIPDLGSS